MKFHNIWSNAALAVVKIEKLYAKSPGPES
jgi:hypothetical protein